MIGETVARLRAATQVAHDRVDAAFGRYPLDDAKSYAECLTAHARALPAAETLLAARPLPVWQPRTPLLTEDLYDLGKAMPPPLPFALPEEDGAAWGALYVIEGSRLGGTMLARRVGADLPVRYLGARHAPGGWRALLEAIERRGADKGWADALLAGAAMTFALYEDAALTPFDRCGQDRA